MIRIANILSTFPSLNLLYCFKIVFWNTYATNLKQRKINGLKSYNKMSQIVDELKSYYSQLSQGKKNENYNFEY